LSLACKYVVLKCHTFDMQENSFKIHTKYNKLARERKRIFFGSFPSSKDGIGTVITGRLLLHIETQNLDR
jgi:hypothetical protein